MPILGGYRRRRRRRAARGKLRDAVERSVAEQTDEIFPFIAAIAGAKLDDAERDRLERIQGESREKLIRTAIATLLRRASERAPIVLVMDDLHWADISSIELLESISRLVTDHPILLLLAFRPGYADTSGRMLEACAQQFPERHVEIELGPLDARAARALIKNLFRDGDIPHVTRSAIEEKTRGNPFYIEEVVRTLVDLGAVEYGRRRASTRPRRLASVEIPDTVQEAVMARVDRLAARAQAPSCRPRR